MKWVVPRIGMIAGAVAGTALPGEMTPGGVNLATGHRTP